MSGCLSHATRFHVSASRIVGPAAHDALGQSTAAAAFRTALNQSFSEQYAAYSLLIQLGAPVNATSAPDHAHRR